jgi:RimJ/RimL family protein N-acetyltransferase
MRWVIQEMIQPDLKTKRLLLRRFRLDESVSKMTLNISYPYKAGMAEEWISSHQEDRESKTGISYAIVKLDSNQLIGTMSLVRIDGSEGELGYWIGQPYWGVSYCTDAARELIRFSFEYLGLEKIVSEHLVSNPASGRVMEKAGMRHDMTTQKLDRDGKMASLEVYKIRNTQHSHAV